MANSLAALIDANPAHAATATTGTVAASWSAVSAALQAQIERGEAVSVWHARPVDFSGVVTGGSSAVTYTLTVGSDSVSTTLAAADADSSPADRARAVAAALAALTTAGSPTYGVEVIGDVLWITRGADNARRQHHQQQPGRRAGDAQRRGRRPPPDPGRRRHQHVLQRAGRCPRDGQRRERQRQRAERGRRDWRGPRSAISSLPAPHQSPA